MFGARAASIPVMNPGLRYRGRFAPSPSGPLHFGSAVAAIASYLQAHSMGGEWLLRMEDLDQARTVAGASNAIIEGLKSLGLYWDGPVLYQSTRVTAYEEALGQLIHNDWAYPCGCTRKEVAGRPYSGTCRHGLPAGRKGRSLRLRTDAASYQFPDHIHGVQTQALEKDVGDFIIRRGDGVPAYHLAVVVDDAFQGITEIVRGSDLLDSTACHIHLQRALDYPQPAYAHLPVVTNAAGIKLSKQTGAKGVANDSPEDTWLRALSFLGQELPPIRHSTETIRDWAIAHWKLERVPRILSAR